ncbi:hypothetical protein [Gottfriedia acidiceleris]|uniref:hypothetical protein n=1 Tax=Gottfriedia acidiceleris TaxID=371036 RepID=UPI0030001874
MNGKNNDQLLNQGEIFVKKFIKILLIVSLIFFIVSLVTINFIANKSSEMNFEKKAGGYQYSVNLEQKPYKWKVGHNDSILSIRENKENAKDLEKFRSEVDNIDLQKIKLTLSILYFFITLFTLIILKKKKVNVPKAYLIFIILLCGFALYKSFVTYVDLNTSINSAKFYYLLITN